MNQTELETFIASLDNVQRSENFGYIFFFVGDDHHLPFVTLANTDQDFDHVSHLNREGVFRVNIGVSRATFKQLLGEPASEAVDYTGLNTFLPHPDYAAQNFICILNPADENVEATQKLIIEAHSIAAARFLRKNKRKSSM